MIKVYLLHEKNIIKIKKIVIALNILSIIVNMLIKHFRIVYINNNMKTKI